MFEPYGTSHVYYIAADQTIRELAYVNGRWVGVNLSVLTGAPPPKQNSPMAAYVAEFENTAHVIYIANNGDIQELYWSGGWVAGRPDLTQTTGTPKPGPNSGLAGYSAEYERTQHVIYVDGNGYIQELYHSGGSWLNTNLSDSAGSGATPPMGGTPLAGYSFEGERTHHVIYIDNGTNVHELYRSGNAWGSGVWAGTSFTMKQRSFELLMLQIGHRCLGASLPLEA